eukprot:gnl/TRDRNA2_/TRDRNA2_186499_c0_seq1.p1 gnl/TRDRNA2_/TRDRNA2_186499_c0~~gnl/TRDRNA2_/TRDRNA2_186499_c0_seq1.p1  ORF type:complete len:418 (+),score=52.25 gnl/TRDRNA2_/TRDRNA2_186499_c0_seq1:93-1346(+)
MGAIPPSAEPAAAEADVHSSTGLAWQRLPQDSDRVARVEIHPIAGQSASVQHVVRRGGVTLPDAPPQARPPLPSSPAAPSSPSAASVPVTAAASSGAPGDLTLNLQIFGGSGPERRAQVHMSRESTVADLKARHFADEASGGWRPRFIYLGRQLADDEPLAHLSSSILQCYLQRVPSASEDQHSSGVPQFPGWAWDSSNGAQMMPLPPCTRWQNLAFHSLFAIGLATAWGVFFSDSKSFDTFGRFVLHFFTLAWVAVCSSDLLSEVCEVGASESSDAAPARAATTATDQGNNAVPVGGLADATATVAGEQPVGDGTKAVEEPAVSSTAAAAQVPASDGTVAASTAKAHEPGSESSAEMSASMSVCRHRAEEQPGECQASEEPLGAAAQLAEYRRQQRERFASSTGVALSAHPPAVVT